MTTALSVFCLLLACGSAPEAPPAPPPPPPGSTRPAECQKIYELMMSCGDTLKALPNTRVLAVAECRAQDYLGDTELQAFLRCLGPEPACVDLVRCSGSVETVQELEEQGAAPAPAGQ